MADYELQYLRGNAGAGLCLLHALPLAGAHAGAARLSGAGPRGDLPADCGDVYAVHAGLDARTDGWTLLGVVWTLAVAGVVFKSLAVGRFPAASATVYIMMGWCIVFGVRPLLAAITWHGMMWLGAGGLAYTLGIVFFANDRLHYFHALWHLFVLAGSMAHYFAILFYVVPPRR